eukprot:361427-Chlamydomonas_euryale.AAC.3
MLAPVCAPQCTHGGEATAARPQLHTRYPGPFLRPGRVACLCAWVQAKRPSQQGAWGTGKQLRPASGVRRGGLRAFVVATHRHVVHVGRQQRLQVDHKRLDTSRLHALHLHRCDLPAARRDRCDRQLTHVTLKEIAAKKHVEEVAAVHERHVQAVLAVLVVLGAQLRVAQDLRKHARGEGGRGQNT